MNSESWPFLICNLRGRRQIGSRFRNAALNSTARPARPGYELGKCWPGLTIAPRLAPRVRHRPRQAFPEEYAPGIASVVQLDVHQLAPVAIGIAEPFDRIS